MHPRARRFRPRRRLVYAVGRVLKQQKKDERAFEEFKKLVAEAEKSPEASKKLAIRKKKDPMIRVLRKAYEGAVGLALDEFEVKDRKARADMQVLYQRSINGELKGKLVAHVAGILAKAKLPKEEAREFCECVGDNLAGINSAMAVVSRLYKSE